MATWTWISSGLRCGLANIARPGLWQADEAWAALQQPVATREPAGAGVTWIRIGTATERLHDGAGRGGLRCASYSIPLSQPDDSA